VVCVIEGAASTMCLCFLMSEVYTPAEGERFLISEVPLYRRRGVVWAFSYERDTSVWGGRFLMSEVPHAGSEVAPPPPRTHTQYTF
jgi:hypothetical protein